MVFRDDASPTRAVERAPRDDRVLDRTLAYVVESVAAHRHALERQIALVADTAPASRGVPADRDVRERRTGRASEVLDASASDGGRVRTHRDPVQIERRAEIVLDPAPVGGRVLHDRHFGQRDAGRDRARRTIDGSAHWPDARWAGGRPGVSVADRHPTNVRLGGHIEDPIDPVAVDDRNGGTGADDRHVIRDVEISLGGGVLAAGGGTADGEYVGTSRQHDSVGSRESIRLLDGGAQGTLASGAGADSVTRRGVDRIHRASDIERGRSREGRRDE